MRSVSSYHGRRERRSADNGCKLSVAAQVGEAAAAGRTDRPDGDLEHVRDVVVARLADQEPQQRLAARGQPAERRPQRPRALGLEHLRVGLLVGRLVIEVPGSRGWTRRRSARSRIASRRAVTASQEASRSGSRRSSRCSTSRSQVVWATSRPRPRRALRGGPCARRASRSGGRSRARRARRRSRRPRRDLAGRPCRSNLYHVGRRRAHIGRRGSHVQRGVSMPHTARMRRGVGVAAAVVAVLGAAPSAGAAPSPAQVARLEAKVATLQEERRQAHHDGQEAAELAQGPPPARWGRRGPTSTSSRPVWPPRSRRSPPSRPTSPRSSRRDRRRPASSTRPRTTSGATSCSSTPPTQDLFRGRDGAGLRRHADGLPRRSRPRVHRAARHPALPCGEQRRRGHARARSAAPPLIGSFEGRPHLRAPPPAQWAKWRRPVKTIAMPAASAAATTSSSRFEPPGWIDHARRRRRPAPAGRRRTGRTRRRRQPAPGAEPPRLAHRELGRRRPGDIWPAPIPLRSDRSLASTMAFERTCLATRQANSRSPHCCFARLDTGDALHQLSGPPTRCPGPGPGSRRGRAGSRARRASPGAARPSRGSPATASAAAARGPRARSPARGSRSRTGARWPRPAAAVTARLTAIDAAEGGGTRRRRRPAGRPGPRWPPGPRHRGFRA